MTPEEVGAAVEAAQSAFDAGREDVGVRPDPAEDLEGWAAWTLRYCVDRIDYLESVNLALATALGEVLAVVETDGSMPPPPDSPRPLRSV